MAASDLAPASAVERFQLRELIAAWNRALDRSDPDGLKHLTAENAIVVYEADRYEGLGAVEELLAAHGGRPEAPRRTHVNHVQAWKTASGFRLRALSMVVSLAPASTSFGDGAPSLTWVGYTEDDVIANGERWQFVTRAFARWGGPILDRFIAAREVAR